MARFRNHVGQFRGTATGQDTLVTRVGWGLSAVAGRSSQRRLDDDYCSLTAYMPLRQDLSAL